MKHSRPGTISRRVRRYSHLQREDVCADRISDSFQKTADAIQRVYRQLMNTLNSLASSTTSLPIPQAPNFLRIP
jgi:hypothetical protein